LDEWIHGGREKPIIHAAVAWSGKFSRAAEPLFFLQKRERFVVAAPLQKVRELRIDRRWELGLELRDSLGDSAEPIQVGRRVTRVEFPIRNDCESFAQSGGQSLVG
jgi:hypothetical protein